MVIVRVECDLCGAHGREDFDHILDWSDDAFSYNVDETSMSITEGCDQPDGGSTTTVSADICPTCFRNVVMPWLISQGVVFKEDVNEF